MAESDEALHTPAILLISPTEDVMDCDATCLVTGLASPLLNLIGFLIFCAIALCASRGSGAGGHHRPRYWAAVVVSRCVEREAVAWSVKPMSSWKHEFARLCARVERRCARMNGGLVAVAVVLTATTVFLSLLRVSDEIARDEQLGTLPFIEMSTDGPNTGTQSMSH